MTGPGRPRPAAGDAPKPRCKTLLQQQIVCGEPRLPPRATCENQFTNVPTPVGKNRDLADYAALRGEIEHQAGPARGARIDLRSRPPSSPGGVIIFARKRGLRAYFASVAYALTS